MAGTFFSDLPRVIRGRTRRESSWDRSGRNEDCIPIPPGETVVLADIEGPGIIAHIYFTMIAPDPMDYRDAILRMYWDDEPTPSVEVPVGDFFCVSNCTVRYFSSFLMSVNPGSGKHQENSGLNCYFPMPFATRAKITLENPSRRFFGGGFGRLWYHIDYETREGGLDKDTGRFHAQWRRKKYAEGPNDEPQKQQGPFEPNLTGADNYVMLEAQGQGHVAGLLLQVDNIQGGWFGEGDDMIFIDGDTWPPAIHGTGTEEIFGGGACPDKEYAGVYSGFLLVENAYDKRHNGKNAMYRWYVNDPIRFCRSIRMTVEHGHANDYSSDYSSVVYWYQLEPHAPFPALPRLEDRRPFMPEGFFDAHRLMEQLNPILVPTFVKHVFDGDPLPEWMTGIRRRVFDAIMLMRSK